MFIGCALVRVNQVTKANMPILYLLACVVADDVCTLGIRPSSFVNKKHEAATSLLRFSFLLATVDGGSRELAHCHRSFKKASKTLTTKSCRSISDALTLKLFCSSRNPW